MESPVILALRHRRLWERQAIFQLGSVILLTFLGGCRQSPEQESTPTPNQAPPSPLQTRPRMVRIVRPADVVEAPAVEEKTFGPIAITCQTVPSRESIGADAMLLKAETVPAAVIPGSAPELRLGVRHGPAVHELSVHIELNRQAQEMTVKPEVVVGEASALESNLTLKFPDLPGGTLVRYWVESKSSNKVQRLPALTAATPKLAFYVQDQPAGCKIPFYELKLEPNDLLALERKAFSNETVPAVFIANGEVYDGVRVRYRGAWARTWPKKPLKIFFNKEKPFQGERTLNLNSGWRDPALVRECLAYHIFTVCGVPAPQSKMVRLHINNQFRGLYVQVQQPDKEFLNRFKLKGASLYKATSKSNQADERDLGSPESYARHYEIKTQKDNGYDPLREFCHELATTSNLIDFCNRRLDTDKYINYLAATALLQNWDGFNKNHYLVYDGKGSKKWFVVPWDLDRTLGDHWNQTFGEAGFSILLGTHQAPGITGWNRLEDKFLSEPALRARVLQRLTELLQSEFTEKKLFPMLDQLETEISSEAALDGRRWPGEVADLPGGFKQLKEFIRERRAFLMREIATLQGRG